MHISLFDSFLHYFKPVQYEDKKFNVVNDLYQYIFSFLSPKDQSNIVAVCKVWHKEAVSVATRMQIEKIQRYMSSITNGIKVLDDPLEISKYEVVLERLNDISKFTLNGSIKTDNLLNCKQSLLALKDRILKVLKYVNLEKLPRPTSPPFLFDKLIQTSICYNLYWRGKNIFFFQNDFLKKAVLGLIELEDFKSATVIAHKHPYMNQVAQLLDLILPKLLERKDFVLAEDIAGMITLDNRYYNPYYVIASTALLDEKYHVVFRSANKMPLHNLQLFTPLVLAIAQKGQFDMADELATRLQGTQDGYYQLVNKIDILRKKSQINKKEENCKLQ